SAAGRITAKAPGAATVSATSEGKVGTAEVTVLVPVALVAVTPATAELDVGQTLQLVAVPKDAAGNPLNRPVGWLSSNPAVATVDGSGFVRAVGEGSATISATARGQTGTASLTVLVPVASVGINPPSATLAPGATLALTAVVKDAQGNPLTRTVTWVSANPGIGSVDASGLLTAQAPGTVTITATARGVSGQGSYTVQMPVAAVRVQPASVTLSAGQTTQLAAALEDAAGNPLNRPVTWSSSDQAIATVDANGLVTGVAVGDATVSATSEGIQGHAGVTVRVAVGSVVIADPGTDPLEVGLTLQLSATVLDVNGNTLTDRPLTWSSSDAAVATVDDAGLVTAVGRGSATISAAVEGKTASVTVRVVGESTTLGNNLSYPVVFAEGIGITGVEAAQDPGIRPTAAEGITADTVPFFYEGNAPDYGTYYLQQGPNVWRAEWLDGAGAGMQPAEVAWGDNLTHQTWNTHSVIRIEVGLNAYTSAALRGFNMAVLYGTGATEMQGTDGTVVTAVPTVYAVTPRLMIQLLDSLTMQPVYTLFDGAVWEGLAAGGGSGVFSAEVNVGGKIVYGYNLMLQSAVLPSQFHKYGWWRITFKLDDQGQLGGATIPRNTSLDRLVAASEVPTYQPQIDPASNTSWVDIYIQSAKGGGTP
ncbi:MAG TPA: Ig-like domain-containing protein, partial [Gemmatimonadales bacterium]|nr:Ig-like domain-containing protein [Gemmatimonadales bacterium]